MLEHFAERDHTTVSGALARELDGIASAYAGELSWAVAGFADALAWPAPTRNNFPAKAAGALPAIVTLTMSYPECP